MSALVNIFETVTSPVFIKMQKIKPKPSFFFSNEIYNPWYDERCAEKKNSLRMLDKYRGSRDDESRIGMVKARSAYKSFLRKSRYDFDKERTSRFMNAKYKNAKLYWNLLKECAGLKTTDVSLSSFEQYFKAVNNQSDPFYSPDEDVIYFNERYENNEFAIKFEELNVVFYVKKY